MGDDGKAHLHAILHALGSQAEACRPDEPSGAEVMADILTAVFATGPEKHVALGRIAYRAYTQAAEPAAPKPTGRARRALRWVGHRVGFAFGAFIGRRALDSDLNDGG